MRCTAPAIDVRVVSTIAHGVGGRGRRDVLRRASGGGIGHRLRRTTARARQLTTGARFRVAHALRVRRRCRACAAGARRPRLQPRARRARARRGRGAGRSRLRRDDRRARRRRRGGPPARGAVRARPRGLSHRRAERPALELRTRSRNASNGVVLPGAAFLTAGSPMIADAYATSYGVRPRAIHNTFSLDSPGPGANRRETVRSALVLLVQPDARSAAAGSRM